MQFFFYFLFFCFDFCVILYVRFSICTILWRIKDATKNDRITYLKKLVIDLYILHNLLLY